MKKLLSALFLGLVFSCNAYSAEPSQSQTIPDSEFSRVTLYEPRYIPPLSSVFIPPVNIPQKPKRVNQISGIASWYCLSGVSRCTVGHRNGYYAAIRRDLLELRGRSVLVCSGAKCIHVTIIDCNCGPHANLIDLYSDAFRALNSLSIGRMDVTIKWQ